MLPFPPNPDSSFYKELLHLIGLKETDRNGIKLVHRKPLEERLPGALLEEAITQLQRMDLTGLTKESAYDRDGKQDWVLETALELSSTWISRILFLKLLEVRLVHYHKGDQSYCFLRIDKIKNYKGLNSLFFDVLGRKYEERKPELKFLYEEVPYLNSSLFQPSELELQTLMISSLDEGQLISIFPFTVLKENQEERRKGKLSTLEYLLDFLNAYKFSLEESARIGGEDKPLISVSVIGEVLEKINGCKDDASFTPGVSFLSLDREALRKIVLHKFNAANDWSCENFKELSGLIQVGAAASEIINSIKIFDPAVVSARFLLSALSEIILIKNDLGLLQDHHGRRLKGYMMEIVDEQLTVRDREGILFEYQPSSKESQRVQESLFHEKQTIIKDCLFGVGDDLKAVHLCRLRLWIELLKSIYYIKLDEDESNSSPVCYAGNSDLRPEFLPRRELQSLPNLDLNIQCARDKISRITLDADLIRPLD